MTPAPALPQQQNDLAVAPPPVMNSDQILQHVDSVYQGLPAPVKAALDHAHSLTGGTPGSGMADAVKPPSPAIPAEQPLPAMSHQPATPDLTVPTSAMDSSVAPPPVTGAAPVSPHMQKIEAMTAEGPGYNKIHNPFLKGLAIAGDVVGSGLFPGLAQFVPGTSARHQLLIGGEQKALGEEQAGAKNAAEVAREEAETKKAQGEAENQKQAGTYQTAGGGIYNLKTHEWEVEPPAKDKDQLLEIDPDKAKALSVRPNADGKYYIPPQAAGELLKPIAAKEPKEGETPLGEAVPNINAAMTARYQVLHPGAELPKHYVLPSNATKSDFDRTDKLMEGEEKAFGTKANQDQTMELRKQTAALAAARAETGKSNLPAAVEKVNPKLVDKAVGGYEKISDEYQNAQSANDDIQTALDEAKKGNKLAYAYEPVLGVLTINTAAGVKRINMPEVTSYAGAGSLGDKIVGFFGKNTEGKSIPENILKDMGTFHQSLADNAVKKYNAKIDIINKTYGASYPHETASSGGAGGSVVAGKPIVQHSQSTGQYRYSTDGGKTWQAGQPQSTTGKQ